MPARNSNIARFVFVNIVDSYIRTGYSSGRGHEYFVSCDRDLRVDQ